MPRGAVGFALAQAGIGRHQLAGALVGVVILGAERPKGRAADAALACTVDASQHVDARRLCRRHRAAALALRGVMARFLAGRAALTAARPSSAGEALNASAMPFRACGVCIRCSRPSNFALRSSRVGERDLTRASNSVIESSTALGASCLVIATAPPTAACSKIEPNSFFMRLAGTVGTSTSSPLLLRYLSVDIAGPSLLAVSDYSQSGYLGQYGPNEVVGSREVGGGPRAPLAPCSASLLRPSAQGAEVSPAADAARTRRDPWPAPRADQRAVRAGPRARRCRP